MIDTRLGTWTLEAQLHLGPRSTLYRASDVKDSTKRAALHVLFPIVSAKLDLAQFPATMLTFRRLDHPNIAAWYEAGVIGGQAWYATEYIDGQPVTSLLNSNGRKQGLPIAEQLLSFAVQAARGLKHGHQRGLLHRAIRPSHTLITTDGVLKWIDFGVDKVIPASLDLSPTEPFHPLAFQPPEYFTGKPYTRRSDLYAYGCWLYTLTTGRPIFHANSIAEFTQKHCYSLPERPLSLVPGLPEELDDLICALIQKDPNRRPASAAIVCDELDQIRAKLERRGSKVTWPAPHADTAVATIYTETADGPNQPAEPRPMMSRVWFVLPLFLLVLSLGAYLAFRPRPSAEELYAQAEPLLASNNPDDWTRAWDDYLTPLSEAYPDRYKRELAAARAKVTMQNDVRRALEAAQRTSYSTEAERLYYTGLKLAQAGDIAGATRLWKAAELFATLPEEAPWVERTRYALSEAEKLEATTEPNQPSATALDSLLSLVATMKSQRRQFESQQLLDQLEALYRDDDRLLPRIRSLR